jgi:thymidylate synthase (FAD)
MGVCPEQARMVLPQSMMTSWYWTGSLVAFARVVNQRTHSTAQVETKAIAIEIDSVIQVIRRFKSILGSTN